MTVTAAAQAERNRLAGALAVELDQAWRQRFSWALVLLVTGRQEA